MTSIFEKMKQRAAAAAPTPAPNPAGDALFNTVAGNLRRLGMDVKPSKIAMPAQPLSRRFTDPRDRTPVRLLKPIHVAAFFKNGKRKKDTVYPVGHTLTLRPNLSGGITLLEGLQVVYCTTYVGRPNYYDRTVDFPNELHEGTDFEFV